MRKVQKPLAGEYAPYTLAYINLVADDGLVLQHLQNNVQVVKELVRSQSEEKLISRCAEGEWTIKEILTHVIDTERVFSYRALRFARNDTNELIGYDHDAYVVESGANARTIEDILEELTAVRMATIALFKSFDEDIMMRSSLANKHNLSVRAALYIIAGHELHHLQSIRENYLSGV